MNTLLIVDNTFSIQHLTKLLKNDLGMITLFPLTSNFLLIKKIEQDLKPFCKTDIKIVASAKYINDEVTILQKTIHTWSYNLGNYKIGNKKLKEWWLFPDGGGSAWWLGLMSEKNSVQDDVFFKIAQINAIKNHVQPALYDLCVVGLSDPLQKKIITKLLRSMHQNIAVIPTYPVSSNNIKTKLFNVITNAGLVGALLGAIINWLVWLRDSRCARKNLPPLSSRISNKNPFMFVSYFPNVDPEAAKQGIFRNKYGLAIQDKLKEMGIPITWLLMPVFYNNHNFHSAVNLANRFSEKGERLFILQEFFTLRIFFKSVLWWIRHAFLGCYLYSRMNKKLLTEKLTGSYALPLIKYLWWHSCLGVSGVRGIIFYLTYREIFKVIPNVGNCLYYCEMLAWEKALIMAKNQLSPMTRTLAFQHTVVMRNYFNYFYLPEETVQQGQPLDLPLPNVLIANGKLMHHFLLESNYPNLCQAEAVRQLYLNNILQFAPSLTANPILLVAGSCSKNETKSLITMVYLAYPYADKFAIWFKGSPVNPVEPIFAELGIDVDKANYKIQHSDVAELLRATTVAAVANTTVALEAAAFGCAVIVPVFADTMLMNPIVDTDAEHFLVSDVDDFKSIIALTMNGKASANKTNNVIKKCWNIDIQLPLWTKLLDVELYAKN